MLPQGQSVEHANIRWDSNKEEHGAIDYIQHIIGIEPHGVNHAGDPGYPYPDCEEDEED